MSGERRWTIHVCGGRVYDPHGCTCEPPYRERVKVMPVSDHLARVKELEAERDEAEAFGRHCIHELGVAQERAEKEIARAHELRENANAATLRAEHEITNLTDALHADEQRIFELRDALSSLRSKVEGEVERLRERADELKRQYGSNAVPSAPGFLHSYANRLRAILDETGDDS